MPSALLSLLRQVEGALRYGARLRAFLRASLLCALGLSATFTWAGGPAASPAAQDAPAWLNKAIFYEVFPRAFSPAGDLAGVTAQLDRLQKLGVNVLWIMPIHPIGALHRMGTYGSVYAVRDYYAINPDLGTKADLLQLVRAAHQRHMRVILDEVPDHTAWDSVMMAHPAFYRHDAAGHIVSPHDWHDVAALNYSDPGLRQYMTDVFAYWLKNFDLDGFRCDDAGDVPGVFWEQVRTALKAIRPDVLMLAEASDPDLLRGDFDLDYAWPLLETFNQVILQGRPATAIREQLAAQKARFPSGSLHMLVSDDHDTQRATVRYGAEGALAASALVFTLPGAPMLYNGMEVGDASPSAGAALFEKVPVFWASAQTERSFPEFYRSLIALRQSSPALQGGDLAWLGNSDEQHVVTFLRRASAETDLVAVNMASTPFAGTVEADGTDWKEVPLVFAAEEPMAGMPSRQPALAQSPQALPALSLPPFGVRIFRHLTTQ